MAKYDPLKKYLSSLTKNQNEITLTFEQIEKIIFNKLPHSAHNYRPWWGNEVKGQHIHAHAWTDVGWKVDSVNQKNHWVRFIKSGNM
jgi:hypothetical protein